MVQKAARRGAIVFNYCASPDNSPPKNFPWIFGDMQVTNYTHNREQLLLAGRQAGAQIIHGQGLGRFQMGPTAAGIADLESLLFVKL